MGLKSTFKKFFDLDDDLDEVLKDAFSKEGGGVSQIASQSRSTARSVGRKPFVESKLQQPNVVNLKSVHQPSKVMLIEPQGFNDVQTITDHLRHRKSVVFNLHRVSMPEAKRMVDFLSGAVYAIDGNIQKLGPDTFICVPDNVDIDGAISEAIEKRI